MHKLTRHHLVPKERQKKKTAHNNQATIHFGAVVKLWEEKHEAWHLLFKNMTVPEIIECLQRLHWIALKRTAKKTHKVIPMESPNRA